MTQNLSVRRDLNIMGSEENKELTATDIRKTKVELAGEQVQAHLLELTKNTDLSFRAMARKLNEMYGTNISKSNIVNYFKKQQELLRKTVEEQSVLSKLRSELFIDANRELVKDIKRYDKGIEELEGEQAKFMELDVKLKRMGDLIDKKGRLLIRHARLSGKLVDGKGNVNTQINVFQNDDKQSEIIQRLKKVEFKNQPIDVGANEVQETDID